MANDTATQPAAAPANAPASSGTISEKYKARGVFLRVLVYVFATHLFAGFVMLLFWIGSHRH